MAKSFSSVKNLSVFISNAMVRRGYAAAAAAATQTESKVMREGPSKKAQETTVGRRGEKLPWVPDPKTGHYRPDNGTKEVDVAELRALLLKESH